MKIAVASGKGGTGKTLVATNLARTAPRSLTLIDCDVEEPNDALFFPQADLEVQTEQFVDIPQIDSKLCTACGRCVKACRFNALALLAKEILVFEELCHSCGSCAFACPEGAISWKQRLIGQISWRNAESLRLIEGRLEVGVALPVPLIQALKKEARRSSKWTLFDSPPGTSCSMVAAALDTDAVLLVTEPTPFGLHDLRLAVETTRILQLRTAVILNKTGIGTDEVERYCQAENIPLLAKIPYDKQIARLYAQGSLIVDQLPAYRELFELLWLDIIDFVTPPFMEVANG